MPDLEAIDEDLKVVIEALEIPPHGVVVMRGLPWFDGSEQQDPALLVVQYLAERGLDDVLVINLSPGATVETLDVEAMRVHGWVRADGS